MNNEDTELTEIAGLSGIEFFLPGEVLNVKDHYSYLNSEIEKMPALEQERMLSSLPDKVHRLKDPSALEIMALNAAQKSIDSSGLPLEEIDGLLVAQMGGKQFMPLIASYLQLNLGLSTNIVARNINDDNISLINIIKLARIYVRSNICKNVLIVVASASIGGKYGFGADLTNPMCMTLGDGAAAAIVTAESNSVGKSITSAESASDSTNVASTSDSTINHTKSSIACRILGEYMESFPINPRKTGTLNADYGEIRPPHNEGLCFAAEMDAVYGAYYDENEFRFDEIAEKEDFFSGTLRRSSEKLGIDLKDVKHVIPSHNGFYLDTWKKSNPDILKTKYKTIGNTGCSDTLICLAQLSKDNEFESGDIIALWTISKGVQVAIAFLQWV